jgi:hypothetical protein
MPPPKFKRGERAMFRKRVERPVLDDLFTRQSGTVCTVGVAKPDPSRNAYVYYTVVFDGIDDSLIAYSEELSSVPPMQVEDLQKIEW